MALTKADIAAHLISHASLNAKDAKDMVESFFEEICSTLENARQVKISGFGNFELNDKKERPGRNPKTGVAIPVSARRVVTFRSGQKLRARVEAYKGKSESDTSSSQS